MDVIGLFITAALMVFFGSIAIPIKEYLGIDD